MISEVQAKNKRTGMYLALFVLGLVIYSLAVIRTRGALPEPKNLTRLQRVLRGL